MFHNNSFPHAFYNAVIRDCYVYGVNDKSWNYSQGVETGNNRDEFTRGAVEIPLFFIIVAQGCSTILIGITRWFTAGCAAIILD